ncbi:MAG: CoA transferase [Chloroflexi bacterium]|nr:CoA transferase [Chloroflexota bacterium]
MSVNKIVGVDGPMKGVKVLDWTMWQFGPVAASMLGDMGADVIKIEALDGDVGRAVSVMESAKAGLPAGRNAYFETCNRSKRGLAVNLKTEEGRRIVHELVKNADVFIQNFRQGVAERLSMDYETLKEINPRLIYATASGFGPEGPDSGLGSLDGCGQARAGLMMAATPPWAKHPVSVRGAPSDQVGGITLCLGILSALFARESLGIGQKVEVSHLSSSMFLQGLAIGMDLLTDSSFPTLDRDNVRNVMYNIYLCKDESWIRISNPQPARYWKPFVKSMDLEYILEDDRFEGIEGGAAPSPELLKIVEDRFAEKTFKEWDQIFRQHGFIYAKIQTVSELKDDPQVIANNYITDFDHPSIGPIKVCNFPVAFSETPAGVWKEAPELGQDTESILIDELGYDWDDIVKLQEAEAIL